MNCIVLLWSLGLSALAGSAPNVVNHTQSGFQSDHLEQQILTPLRFEVRRTMVEHPTGDVGQEQSLQAQIEFDVYGELYRRVLGEEDGLMVVAMRFANAQVNDSKNTLHPAFLQAPFLVKLGANGQMIDALFAKAIPGRVRDVLIQVANDALPMPLRPTDSSLKSTVWYPRKTESIEYYEDLGAEEASAFKRQRRLMKIDRKVNRLAEDIRYLVAASEGETVWSADGSGLVSTRYTDRWDVYYKGEWGASVESTISAAPSDSDALVDLPSTVEEGYTSLYDNRAERLHFYTQSSDEIRAVKDFSFDDAMENFLRKVDENTPEASFLLRQYVRLRPEDAMRVAYFLNGLPQTDSWRIRTGHGFAALASCGHLEAQRAIETALSQRAFNPIAKDRAARSTLSLTEPERFIPAAMWGYRQSLPVRSVAEIQHQGIVTNLYGAIGGWEHGDPAVKNEVLETLAQAYDASSNVERASALLPALANIGDIDLLWPIFEPLFSNASSIVRRRAFFVFQKAPGDSAFALFAERFANESNASVRLAASAVAEIMPKSDARSAWAVQQASQVRDTVVLGRLVRMIGESVRDEPAYEQTLRTLLVQKIPRDVRSMIYRYVKPGTKGGVK